MRRISDGVGTPQQRAAAVLLDRGGRVAAVGRPCLLPQAQPAAGEAGFDEFVEKLCEPYYHDTLGRPGIPPGIYFRMLLVGYFEGLGSQRGIAWRCADSLSLREFLGVPLTEETPDHSSLTRVRDRLPLAVHQQCSASCCSWPTTKGLLKGKTVGVDATTLEANAAMKSIVRRDTGEDWQEYVRRLMQEAGQIEPGDEPTAEEIARFDSKRKDKKVSNEEWQSETDPDSRITKMKDGRTHLAYKAEHVVDLDTELILAAEIYHADAADVDTIGPSVSQAQDNLIEAESDAEIEEAVADKGYSRTRRWPNWNSPRAYGRTLPNRSMRIVAIGRTSRTEQRQAVTNNRRRVKGKRGALCSASGARRSSGASPTSARRAAVGERGCTGSRRCESDT